MCSEYGKESLTLFTGTLPGKSDEECTKQLEKWPEIMRQFMQSVHRELESSGFPVWACGVSEIQPKRFERTGQPWLHCHVVLPTAIDGCRIIQGKRLKLLWSKACKNSLGGCLSDYALAARVDGCDHKKGEVANYLSKYLGKGSSAIAQKARLAGWKLPRHWWHAPHAMKAAVAAATKTLRPQSVSWLMHLCRLLKDGVSVWAEIKIPCPGDPEKEFPMGYVGRLSRDWMERLFNYDQKLRLNHG
jgi:hypothetical protein